MQTYFFIAAALLYLGCAFLPSAQRTVISIGTVAAWLLHGGALWSEVIAPGSLRVGFAMMLSSALWISVLVYWLENRNFALDGLRVLLFPCAAAALILEAVFPGSVVPLEGNSPLFAR